MENLKEIDIIFTLIAGTFVMFFMAGVIVFSVIKYQKRVLMQKETLRLAEKKYQNDLLDANIIAAENERKTVAKNIHDDIGTFLHLIKQNNELLKINIDNKAKVQELIKNSDKLHLTVYQNMRAIYSDLMSPALQNLGFIRALNELCTQINASELLKIRIDESGEGENSKVRFSSKVEIQLFRICKELINNILKHSKSTEVVISIIIINETLSVTINYNGKGINDEQAKLIMDNNSGLGLKSIYGRIQILNGILNYYTESENKASVVFKIPVKEDLCLTQK